MLYRVEVLCEMCETRYSVTKNSPSRLPTVEVCGACGSDRILTRTDALCTGCGNVVETNALVAGALEFCDKCEEENSQVSHDAKPNTPEEHHNGSASPEEPQRAS